MALNDTYFFTVQGTLAGRNYVHTLHFREILAPPVINPAQSLIDRWQTTCQSAWIAAHPTAYQIVRLTAQKVCGTLPLPSRVEEGVGVSGNRAVGTTGELLPPWLAVAVNESTGLAGRSRHGRFFMSGGGESDVSGETLVSGVAQWLNYITGYVNALTAGFVTGPPADWQLVVHSRKLADVPGTQCNQSSEPVTALGIVSRLTSQRSRRA
jgi:hypothetical protein